MKKRRHLHHRVHNYLFPHKGNKYSPQVFAYSSVIGIIVVLVLLQAVYFLDTKIAFKGDNFLASVLPGVLISLTNTDRTKQNLGTLVEDQLLDKAAQLKADDMAAKGYFAHVTPEGYQPWHWFDAVGYKYEYAGENLAVNFTDSEDVETAWMNSPTHRANIVKPQYTRIGLATADGQYKGKEVTFVVQLFAKPAAAVAKVVPKPLPTPITTAQPASTEVSDAVATSGSAPEQVLGAEVSPVSFWEKVATSPTHTIIYLLSVLAAFFAVLLVIALIVHFSVATVEVLGGGFVLLIVITGFLIFNATQITAVEVPHDGQTATSSVSQ